MITPDQEKWISTLSDKKIVIVPYDTRTEELFAKVKGRINKALGSAVEVEHCGASSLGISGQDEIDVSILARKEEIDEFVAKIEKEFVPAKSRYPDRVRFPVREEGKKIDLKIVDVDHPSHKNSVIFENYLRSHPEALEAYRVLKEECNGMTVKEYYRKKIEFINDILDKARV